MSKTAVDHTDTGVTPWTRFASFLVEKIGFALIGHPQFGAVTVILPNGRTRTIGNTKTGEHAVLRINNFNVITEAMRRGTVGFAAAYMNGDIEVDDLTALFRFFLQNRDMFESAGKGFFRRAATDLHYHMSRRNTLEGSKKNIAEHYDLGNDFYGQWLDPSMTYSSAVFTSGDQSLEEAQRTKYRRVADMAGVTPGSSVLEIGCGWGGFARHAAETRGCRVTGITISREQAAHARERTQGLPVEIREQDYRTVEGSFTKVVSIEMIEAIGADQFGTFFATIDRVLAPGGRAAVQSILIPEERWDRYRRTPDWIERYVFPGCLIPSLEALARAAARSSRLAIYGVEEIGEHYAETLRQWRERFHARIDDVRALGYDRRFERTWDFYLAFCEAAFRMRALRDAQLLFARAGSDG
jgi:cyclopropane-fatty-acyl-phospholipid synthase